MTVRSPTVSVRRHRVKRAVILFLACALVGAVSLLVIDFVKTRRLVSDLGSDDRKTRQGAVRSIAQERETAAGDALLIHLERVEDREELDATAYAVMRLRDLRGVPILMRTVDRGPDDSVTASLIAAAARLADRQPEHRDELLQWMREGVEGNEPWRRIGCAAGLLLMGEPDGGQRLLIEACGRRTNDTGEGARGFAMSQFESVARPMAESLGQPNLAFPEGELWSEEDPRWDALISFWTEYGRAPLLNAVLDRLYRYDPEWSEMKRLINARQLLASWMGADDS